MFGESIVRKICIYIGFLKLRSGWFPARPDNMSGSMIDTPLLNHADIVPTNSNMSHDSCLELTLGTRGCIVGLDGFVIIHIRSRIKEPVEAIHIGMILI